MLIGNNKINNSAININFPMLIFKNKNFTYSNPWIIKYNENIKTIEIINPYIIELIKLKLTIKLLASTSVNSNNITYTKGITLE